jgi:site-specific DNA-methyltransferase (adenine-specific)
MPAQLGPFELGRVYQAEALAALRLLPDASVDVLLTDPPYSSGGFTQAEKNRDPSRKYVQSGTKRTHRSFSGDNRDGRSWAYWSALWLSESLRVVKPGGYALTFSDWRQLPNATDAFQAGGFIWRGIIAWDKTEGARAPHKGYFRHQCEYVVWGTKGPFGEKPTAGPFPGAFRVQVRRYSDKFHVTGKPTDLLRELVKIAPPGGIVLDPFAGSGTTVLACELEGRVGLGFELESHYVEIANGRLASARERVVVERLEQTSAPAGEPT